MLAIFPLIEARVFSGRRTGAHRWGGAVMKYSRKNMSMDGLVSNRMSHAMAKGGIRASMKAKGRELIGAGDEKKGKALLKGADTMARRQKFKGIPEKLADTVRAIRSRRPATA